MIDPRGSYKRSIGQQNAQRILDLVSGEPLAIVTIADRLNLEVSTVSGHVRGMRKFNKLYIAAWEPGGDRPRAMYRAGHGTDEPRPKNNAACRPPSDFVMPDTFMHAMCALSA